MHRIIVVDDEKFIRESIVSFEWKTIGVQPAGCFENAEDALDYIMRNPVEIVLTDIRMPGMSGVSLVAKIKEITYMEANITTPMSAAIRFPFHFFSK